MNASEKDIVRAKLAEIGYSENVVHRIHPRVTGNEVAVYEKHVHDGRGTTTGEYKVVVCRPSFSADDIDALRSIAVSIGKPARLRRHATYSLVVFG